MIDRRMVVLLVAMALLSGCAQTRHARNVEPSGFLGHAYPLLHEGKKGESLLVYRSPKFANLVKTYDKIQLDPITIWRGKKSQTQGGAPRKNSNKSPIGFTTHSFWNLTKIMKWWITPGQALFGCKSRSPKWKKGRWL